MDRHDRSSTSSRLNRRTALGGIGVAAATAGLGLVEQAQAQEATPASLATHPLAGTWAALTPGGVVPQIHHADGSLITAFPPNYVDPATGLTFQGPALGQWESTSERSGRFTFLQALSDSAGTYIGTFQLADDLEASADGQTWTGSNEAHIIVRDAGNAVILDEAIPFDTPVMGMRMGATIDSLVLPVATPVAGTPTS